LSASPRLRVRHVEEAQARLLVLEERGVFFPTIASSISFRKETDATPYSYMESSGLYAVSLLNYSAGLSGQLPIATRYELSAGSTVSWTDLRAALLSPQNVSTLQLRLVQPLLRGWGYRNTLSRIEVARIDQQASVAETETEVAGLLLKVVRAFWELSRRREMVVIATELVELAQKQAATTRTRIAAGTLSQFDLLEADAALAARRGDLAAAEQARVSAERELLLVLYSTRGGPDLSRSLVPEEPPSPPAEKRSLSELQEIARRERPELRMLETQLRARLVAATAARNASRPRLDLEAVGGLASLAGTVSARCAPSDPSCIEPAAVLQGGHGTSWKQVFNGTMPYWQLGLKFELPLSGDLRRREEQREALQRRRLEAGLEGARAQIAVEVRDALLRLQVSSRRLAAADEGLSVARQHLAAAERRFAAGLCASYDVLRVQVALGQARREVAQASRDRFVGVAEVESAIGRLPKSLGVSVR
jgi:outer membrane protein TolC